MSKKLKALFGSSIALFLLTACSGGKLPAMDEEEANAIKENIKIVTDDDNKVYGNIRLVTELDGASIKWKANVKDVVSTQDNGDLKAGVVTRQEEDTTVTLTANIEKDGKGATFTQDIVVAKAAPEIYDDDYEAYLFGHFVGEGYGKTENGVKVATGEQMFFALADVGQGLKFKDLNGSTMNNLRPVLSSKVGERGVRDPFILRSPEGDTFYLIATDLSVYTRGGWGANNGETKFTINGSHSITLWESHDLVNWTEGRLIEVAAPNAGMAWAPEMIYSEETGEYVIFFSSTLIATDDNGEHPYIEYRDCIYYTTTRDFQHFSETKKFIKNQPYPNGGTDPQKQQDSPKALNNDERKIIDASVMKIGDWYYSACKDGDNHENNGGILIQKTQNLFDPDSWQKVMHLADLGMQVQSRTADNKCLEGPEWFWYNKADRADENTPEIGLMADFYANTSVGYIPFATTDVEDTTNANQSWRLLKSGTDYSWDNQTKRHGTILRITYDEAERLKEVYHK